MAKLDINAGMVNAQPLQADMTAADLGAGQLEAAGKNVQTGLMQIAEARMRVDNRNDTINRVRAKTKFEDALDAEYQRRQTEVDMTDPAQVEEFQRFSSDTAMNILGSHEGTQESVGKLSITLEELKSKYNRQFSRDVISAGREMAKGNLQSTLTDLADTVSVTGDVDGFFEDVDAAVLEEGDFLETPEEKKFKAVGKQTGVGLLFERLMAERNFEAADTLLNDGRIPEVFGDNIKGLRQMRSKLLVEKYAIDKGKQDGEQEIAKLAYFAGVDVETARKRFGPTLAQKAMRAGDGKQTLAQEVAEFEKVMKATTGNPNFRASPEQVQKMKSVYIASEATSSKRSIAVSNILTASGMDPETITPELRVMIGDIVDDTQSKMGQRVGRLQALFPEASPQEINAMMPNLEQKSDDYGNTFAGITARVFTEVPARINSGNSQPSDWQTLDYFVSQTYAAETRKNPVTGEEVRRKVIIPQHILDTYERHNRQIPVAMDDPEGTDFGGAAQMQRPGSRAATVFDTMEQGALTGIASGLTEFGAGLPGGVGEVVIGNVKGAPELIQARDRVDFVARSLVRTLTNNPRFAEAERQALSEDVKLVPELMSNPERGKLKLFAIDDGLQGILDEGAKALALGTVTAKREALDDYNRIMELRDRLGVPPLLTTREDVVEFSNTNPPGTKFRTKAGEVRTTDGPIGAPN